MTRVGLEQKQIRGSLPVSEQHLEFFVYRLLEEVGVFDGNPL